MTFLRGQIYWLDLGYGEKPWIVVSNNSRNRALGSALVARVTTSHKPPLPSIVELDSQDPVVGSVICDDIETIYFDDEPRFGGAVSLETLKRINAALRVALGLAT
ncbi:type II toxin-antitoxin system PemK/MazF family toxin [Corynebacterium sp. MSK044]|uniref:type II toxin-antitoxin system PemK/MazF family toxin n=1 Tax=Corynebacterium sp. MSK044 TaxID=3050195 RepID=UPI002550B2C1|nr:type II toxin-antitoxin system PemK/MazF family toxin [Corynebacterium sp. MSK044]MDK8796706.1 type II toxin-antitoxin system PemK/MazF family toxin [Corynebacterium sp. MSK044]